MSPATYRLQLRPGFGLAQARELVPYLHRLGITHLYLSPILQARSGSAHGYDVVDPTRVNPELGSESDLEGLSDALGARDMGILLDIVPNHMATSEENPYWEDALTHGRASRFARWFDIDWGGEGTGSKRRVLLPVLGKPLGQTLAQREIRVIDNGGAVRLRYFDRSFPIDPASLPLLVRPFLARTATSLSSSESEGLAATLDGLENAPPRESRFVDRRAEHVGEAVRRFRRLCNDSAAVQQAVVQACEWISLPEARPAFRRLLKAQAYRLAYWRRAAREINYRRFFTISHLVGLRQEDPEVFHATHATVLEWAREGWITGLRIDHIDGLRDPRGYLEGLSEAVPDAPATEGGFPLFVEKILAPRERLPSDWPVAGTTGYEALNAIEDLFIDPGGHSSLLQSYRRFTGRRGEFAELATRSKRLILREHLAAEVRRVARQLARATGKGLGGPDLRLLESAVREVATNLAVYRTYIRRPPCEPASQDRAYLEQALERARQSELAPESALTVIESALLDYLATDDHGTTAGWHEFVARFQQLTGPAMAKGVEDTAHYIHVPLISRNEVGGEPDFDLEDAAARLHRLNTERLHRHPDAMVCVSTHDTKRSADVRSRLDTLSDSAGDWNRTVARWAELNDERRIEVGGRRVPDRNTEHLLYQTLVGIWPAPGRLEGPDTPELEAIRERVQAYMLKAVREAKQHTSWVEPDQAYESALHGFIQRILSGSGDPPFVEELNEFVARVARPGFWNACARALIQLTIPGTPDTYQGDELWNLLLVDPDNRRPVDFATRQRLLDQDLDLDALPGSRASRALAEMARSPEDGQLKMRVVRTALGLRGADPELFERGDYLPLQARGERSAHVFAFARRQPDRAAVTVAPVRAGSLVPAPNHPPIGAVWGDTRLQLPPELSGRRWTCALSGAVMSNRGSDLAIEDLFQTLPVALIVSKG